jgi:hypothetical protein
LQNIQNQAPMPAPAPMQTPTPMATPGTMPMQKRGGKVKKAC